MQSAVLGESRVSVKFYLGSAAILGYPASMPEIALSYCGELVRAHDRDRFLLSLLGPKEGREGLWALFAFNHEIARTREVVTETAMGHIRLQWWRDAIAGVYAGNTPDTNPVLAALAETIRKHGLPQDDFDALLYAREFDLEGVAPASPEGLEKYAGFTTAPLNRLALKVRGEAADEAVLRDVSVAYALAGLLRAVPFHESQGSSFMPSGMKREDAVRAVATRACALCTPHRKGRGFIYASARLAAAHLKNLEKCSFDVYDIHLKNTPTSFILKEFLGLL